MSVSDYNPVNPALILNPWNWAVVLLMVLIAGLGLSLLFPHKSSET